MQSAADKGAHRHNLLFMPLQRRKYRLQWLGAQCRRLFLPSETQKK